MVAFRCVYITFVISIVSTVLMRFYRYPPPPNKQQHRFMAKKNVLSVNDVSTAFSVIQGSWDEREAESTQRPDVGYMDQRMGRCPSNGLALGQRVRRWPSAKPLLAQRPVSAGDLLVASGSSPVSSHSCRWSTYPLHTSPSLQPILLTPPRNWGDKNKKCICIYFQITSIQFISSNNRIVS